MILVGASHWFCAAHTLPQHPTPHGHSYSVTAYVREPACAEALQARVREVCGLLDHKNLDDILPASTMEEVAKFFAVRLAAERVVISRPLEGVCVEWSA